VPTGHCAEHNTEDWVLEALQIAGRSEDHKAKVHRVSCRITHVGGTLIALAARRNLVMSPKSVCWGRSTRSWNSPAGCSLIKVVEQSRLRRSMTIRDLADSGRKGRSRRSKRAGDFLDGICPRKRAEALAEKLRTATMDTRIPIDRPGGESLGCRSTQDAGSRALADGALSSAGPDASRRLLSVSAAAAVKGSEPRPA